MTRNILSFNNFIHNLYYTRNILRKRSKRCSNVNLEHTLRRRIGLNMSVTQSSSKNITIILKMHALMKDLLSLKCRTLRVALLSCRDHYEESESSWLEHGSHLEHQGQNVLLKAWRSQLFQGLFQLLLYQHLSS